MQITIANQFPKLDPPGVARVAIVGESLGIQEEQQGIPFCGASGNLLNAALSQVGIVRDQCFVGNVINFRPEGNDVNRVDWDSAEVQASIAQLRQDLIKFRPSMILCLGNAALHLMKRGNIEPRKTRQKRKQEGGEDDGAVVLESRSALSGRENGEAAQTGQAVEGSTPSLPSPYGSFLWPDKIGSWRGSLFESEFLLEDEVDANLNVIGIQGSKVKCLSTFHPAAVLRDFSLQPLFKLDLKRVAQEAKTRELELPKRRISILAPPVAELAEVVKDLIRLRHSAKRISFDLEGHTGNVTCLGFADSADYAIVIPLAHADGTSVWSEDEEVVILDQVKLLLEDPAIEKVMQNGLYDAFVLAWTYGIVIRNFAFDTMVGMWECFAELPKGLATQASILTKEPFYKPDKGEEGEMKFASDEEFWRYNGLDACVTFECHEAQMKLLNDAQKAHYAFNMQLMPALLFMEMRGMKWDCEAAAQAREEALKKAWEMQARIDEEARRVFLAQNPDGIKQGAFDLCDLLTAVQIGDERLLVPVIISQLCQKNIKRPVEVVEERWQPKRWDGKKWKKDGKQTSAPYNSAFASGLPLVFSKGPCAPHDCTYWLEPKHKKTTRNQPFSPSTLAECEEFVLESCRGEWGRVKEIWKELNYARPVSNDTGRVGGDSFAHSKLCLRPVEPEKHDIHTDAGHQKMGDTTTRTDLLGELSTLLSLSINVGSTQADGDAQRFLYEICGFKEQFKKTKGKKTDKVSSDQNALVKLYGDTKDVRVLWVLQLRRLRKLASDLALEVDDDGRLRSTFSLVKETGRMSASASPTGKGTNAQALNKDLRYLVKADEGCQLRQRDLEGADSWTVACECAALGDETMLLDLKAGLKPAQALCVMFDRPEAASWDRAQLKAHFKEHKKRFAQWHYPGFKSTKHGTAYGMGIPTMMQTVLRNSMANLPLDLSKANPVVMSYKEAEAFRALVLKRYPGILKWHAKSAANLIRDGKIETSAGHIRRFYGRKRDFKNGQWVANHDTLKEYLASAPQFWTTWATKKALWRLWYDEENRLPLRVSAKTNPDENGEGHTESISAYRAANEGDQSRLGNHLRCEPLFCVHDSILTQVKEEDAAWAEAKEAQWFNNPITVAGIEVVIPSEGQVSNKDWSMK